jgi:uncharacterized protein involved in exopolysaccharide biosynthesis
MRKLLVPLVIFAAAALTGCGLNLFTKTYKASAMMQVDPRDGFPLADESKVVLSPDVLEPAIRDLGLQQSLAKEMGKPLPLSMQEATDRVRQTIKLDVTEGTKVITITVVSHAPNQAPQIANAIADMYKVRRDVEEDQKIAEEFNSFQRQLGAQEAALGNAQAAATLAPHDTTAQRKVSELELLVAALKMKRQTFASQGPLPESPVRILKRAEP